MAQEADKTLYEGEGGGYYVWSNEKTPLLSEYKLGGAKLLLHPLGLAIPHYADSSKIGFVVQGNCTVGLVPPNTSEETVVVIKKGDAIPVTMGVVSWWFNGGDTDVLIVFLGETNKAQVPGQFTYFFMAGTLGILHGFRADYIGKAFSLDQKESEKVANNQPASLMLKLENGDKFPKPSKQTEDKDCVTIDDILSADIVVKGGGIDNLLTEKKMPKLANIGLSARFVRLEGNATLAPSYLSDGSFQVIYVIKGSGHVRIVGADGNPTMDTKVQEGEMFIVPRFFVVMEIADRCGMELFSVMTSSMPVFAQLDGDVSIWNAVSPVVLQYALNISPESAEAFKARNAESITIIPSST